MPSIAHELDGYEFSPQNDRISLRAKMVYEAEADRIGYTVWDQQAHDWGSPYFRDPPAPGATPAVPDTALAMRRNDTFDQKNALCALMRAGVIFVNYRRYVVNDFLREPLHPGTEEISDQRTMVVFVNCNDVFAWGVAESEEISSQADLKRLMAHRRRDPVYGTLKWACQTRNEQPQAPWVREMKEAGAWTELMANLPANAYGRIRSVAAK